MEGYKGIKKINDLISTAEEKGWIVQNTLDKKYIWIMDSKIRKKEVLININTGEFRAFIYGSDFVGTDKDTHLLNEEWYIDILDTIYEKDEKAPMKESHKKTLLDSFEPLPEKA